MAITKTKASFIEPMLLLRSESLPEGPNWQLELKLDGYTYTVELRNAVRTVGTVLQIAYMAAPIDIATESLRVAIA